jgi:hypothetical protein
MNILAKRMRIHTREQAADHAIKYGDYLPALNMVKQASKPTPLVRFFNKQFRDAGGPTKVMGSHRSGPLQFVKVKGGYYHAWMKLHKRPVLKLATMGGVEIMTR